MGAEDEPHDEHYGPDDDNASNKDSEDAADEGGTLLVGIGIGVVRVGRNVEVCALILWWRCNVRVCSGSVGRIAVGSRRSGVAGDGPVLIGHCM